MNFRDHRNRVKTTMPNVMNEQNLAVKDKQDAQYKTHPKKKKIKET